MTDFELVGDTVEMPLYDFVHRLLRDMEEAKQQRDLSFKCSNATLKMYRQYAQLQHRIGVWAESSPGVLAYNRGEPRSIEHRKRKLEEEFLEVLKAGTDEELRNEIGDLMIVAMDMLNLIGVGFREVIEERLAKAAQKHGGTYEAQQ